MEKDAKNMKKILAFVLAMAMICSLLAFAGCGDDKAPAKDPEKDPTSQNPPADPKPNDPVTPDPKPQDPVTPPTTDPVTPPADPVTPPTTDPVTPPTTDPVTPPTDPVTPPAPPHNHSWDNGVVSKEATCGTEGAKLYSCACGEKKLESIPKKTEHTWDNGVIEGATKTITCTVCGEKKTEKIEGVHEHSWGDPVTTKAPTCSEEGIVTFTCSCGEKLNGTVRPTGNHKWNNQGICTVCGDIKTSASPSDIG
jgi:hypothetical protein